MQEVLKEAELASTLGSDVNMCETRGALASHGVLDSTPAGIIQEAYEAYCVVTH